MSSRKRRFDKLLCHDAASLTMAASLPVPLPLITKEKGRKGRVFVEMMGVVRYKKNNTFLRKLALVGARARR